MFSDLHCFACSAHIVVQFQVLEVYSIQKSPFSVLPLATNILTLTLTLYYFHTELLEFRYRSLRCSLLKPYCGLRKESFCVSVSLQRLDGPSVRIPLKKVLAMDEKIGAIDSAVIKCICQ